MSTYEPRGDGRLTLVHDPIKPFTMPLDSSVLPRACWFQKRTLENHLWVIGDWEPGTLHMWGMDHVEFETGPGSFPIGVVEDKTGFVHTISVDRIRLEIS